MTGYNPRTLAAEHARHDATAHDWHETDAARTLIARHIAIDDSYQSFGIAIPTRLEDAYRDELNDLAGELDTLRYDRIREEIKNLSTRDQDDDELINTIEESAPSVSDVLRAARLADALSIVPQELAA